MTDLLGRIDNVLASDLCPCGAPPAPGSAYCGDDCTPTHIAGDTDRSGPGEYGAQSTSMRWRPDLISAHNDSRLGLSTRFRRGRYTATVYEINDSDGVHCRLDDGNRFVGLDADGHQFVSDEGLEPVWERLERELGNSRNLDPASGPAVVDMSPMFRGISQAFEVFARDVAPAFERFNTLFAQFSPATRGSLWREQPTTEALTAAVALARPDCAAWPRLQNRTPLARYLLITQRRCHACGRHGVPGPAVGELTRHRCPHCAATYPGADVKVSIRTDLQRDQHIVRVSVGTTSASQVVDGLAAELRYALQRCYDKVELAILTELGLTPTVSRFDQDRAVFMHSFYVTPTVDPVSILRTISLT